MNNSLLKKPKKPHGAQQSGAIALYPGIELSYLQSESDSFSVRHKSAEHIIQISYCKAGQTVWRMKDGNFICLNPGDFTLHTPKACTDAVITHPTGGCAWLSICLDLQKAAAQPPELLDSEIFEKKLCEKFCRDDTVSFFAGNEHTERIFSAFYGQPEQLRLSYQRLKTAELLLYLARPEHTPQKQLTAYQSEQIEIIREIHDRLTGQMDERITIEELSKQYLINPTTLKTAFKAVYGDSIAAHIKEHRMEQAAKMLRETDMNIAETAQAVGYDSQSKFTAAFKASYGVLPREYRKNHK